MRIKLHQRLLWKDAVRSRSKMSTQNSQMLSCFETCTNNNTEKISLTSIMLQSNPLPKPKALTNLRKSHSWKSAIVNTVVMNELEYAIQQLLDGMKKRGVDSIYTSMAEEHSKYDETLVWAMQHANAKEQDQLNHCWKLLCKVQELRLGENLKKKWLWSMAQRIHKQHNHSSN